MTISRNVVVVFEGVGAMAAQVFKVFREGNVVVFSDVDERSLRCCIVYSVVAFTLLFLALLFGFGSDWQLRRVRQGSGRGEGGWFEMARWREEDAFGLRVLGGGANMHLQTKSIELLIHKVRSCFNVSS